MKEKLINELLTYFINKNAEYKSIDIPIHLWEKRTLLRQPVNMRLTEPISTEILDKEDQLLGIELQEKKYYLIF